MTIPPSGEQFEIRAGGQRATIVEVGGGGAHGAPLVPWPNRLADGRYSFDGEDYQVALTEPEKHNAIHGLMLWRPWQVAERDAKRIVMGARLHPLTGFPFTLDIHIAYELGEDGLSVTTTARNVGDRACPYGHGQHPYLSPGHGLIDDCSLQLAAQTRIVTDAERPQIDHAFTDLTRDASGRAWTHLRGADGACAEPNAFASGDGLIRLEPGDSVTTSWGMRLS